MQEDVLGLDVAMDDVVPVRVVERSADFGRDAHRVRDGELLLALEAVAQRLAVDERHDVEEKGSGRPRIEERQDVRMLQVRRGLDLAEEPLGADHRRQLGPEHLDGDPALVPDVLGQEHGRHAARANLALEAIAIRERR